MSEQVFSSASATARPIPPDLLNLAPLNLRNYRHVRYKADDQCISLGDLEGIDRHVLQLLYHQLSDLLQRLTSARTSDAQKLEDVLAWSKGHHLPAMVEAAQQMGLHTLEKRVDVNIAKAMHDIRGGALTSLFGYLQLLPRSRDRVAQLSNFFRLTRDQLKIMRSAVLGLDDGRREHDTLLRTHDVKLMLGKWHAVVVGPKVGEEESHVRMFVDCRHEGAVSECCLESAALDRIFHNLTSNACRHAAGDRINLLVFHIPPPEGSALRYVLSNVVSPEDAARLRSLQGEGPQSRLDLLFSSGVSSTGSGFGLAVVADFVAGAFGLTSSAEAVAQGYVGAVLQGEVFRVWFHWPVTRSNYSPKSDEYTNPN